MIACCTREISEANVPIRIRPGAARNKSSNAASITVSDGVHPGWSALVESAISASEASAGWPECRNIKDAPSPIRMMPMFSML